jgi:hypothetical protein
MILNQSSISHDPLIVTQTLQLLGADLEFLRSSYPNFEHWFTSKVIPGIYTGERTLILEQRESSVVALMILKHTDTEKKLCTLRVRPHHESKGLGVRLFHTAFDILETERPLLSVSQPIEPKFHRIFNYFGFTKQAVYKARYLPAVDELAYNGLLEMPKIENRDSLPCLKKDNILQSKYILRDSTPYLRQSGHFYS